MLCLLVVGPICMDLKWLHFPKRQRTTGWDLALVNLWQKIFAILQFVQHNANRLTLASVHLQLQEL
jgi:hypothetical protein